MEPTAKLYIKDDCYCLVMNVKEAHIVRTLLGSYCVGPAVEGLCEALDSHFPKPMAHKWSPETKRIPKFE